MLRAILIFFLTRYCKLSYKAIFKCYTQVFTSLFKISQMYFKHFTNNYVIAFREIFLKFVQNYSAYRSLVA